MEQNRELYDFFMQHAAGLTERWYESIEDDDPESIYRSTDSGIIAELKRQNQDYYQHFIRALIEEKTYLHTEFKKWSEDLASDPKHLNTPLDYVVREYMSNQKIVLHYVKEFIKQRQGNIDIDRIFYWYDLIAEAFNISIHVFIQQYVKNTTEKLMAQRDLIYELSSPVIVLKKHIALLPLVGDIDTARAKFILENTLQECSQKGVQHLCLDLSGVVMIDTMVAQEIFHLMTSLRLIGVETIISGIRPEIAQTAVQLGLPLNELRTASSLAHSLDRIADLSSK
ncbi:STAS domain-containing protein [Bacillus sp. 179-C3.3 HS]|uniref:STAS domain-containing protein n=1 Tax=Bacillus sp. 179-C3.3 HS TaxID=3232162 RepID=UPI0039A278E2